MDDNDGSTSYRVIVVDQNVRGDSLTVQVAVDMVRNRLHCYSRLA